MTVMDKIIDFTCRRTRSVLFGQLLVIVVVGFLAYANTFDAQFNFDDISSILGNPVVRSADPLADPMLFKGTRAVGDMTFALNYRWGEAHHANGFWVRGYHYVNLVIHLANALLVYFLIRLVLQLPFFRQRQEGAMDGAIAFMTALFFVAHPLQTQAVTYIVQRYTSLATFFYLAAILAYLEGRLLWVSQSVAKRWGAIACWGLFLLTAMLAMLTKEISFTLPFMVLLCEFMFFRGNLRKRLIIVGSGCLALAAVIPVAIVKSSGWQVLTKLEAVTKVQTSMPRLDYLYTQSWVVANYLRLLLVPAGQNLDHDVDVLHSFLRWQVVGSFALLSAIFLCGLFLLYRSRTVPSTQAVERSGRLAPDPRYRLIAFGIFWFFIALSVESSFIPIIDVMFEHRVYLPSVGFFLAITTTMVLMAERWAVGRKKLAVMVLLIVLLIPVVLAIVTYNRNRVWADDLTLWQDAAAKSPNKTRPWDNLAAAYLKLGEPKKAIPALIRSIAISPVHPATYNNIGKALVQLGTYDGRFSPTYEMFDMTSGIDAIYQAEWFALAYNNLGLAYDSLGETAQAMESFRKSIDMNPRLAEARFNLALSCAATGDQAGLKEQYQVLKQTTPQLAEKLRGLTSGAH